MLNLRSFCAFLSEFGKRDVENYKKYEKSSCQLYRGCYKLGLWSEVVESGAYKE